MNQEIPVEEIARRYRTLFSGLVYDQLDAMGLGHMVLANEIKPLRQDMLVAGPAFTVKGIISPDSLPGHNQVQLEMFYKFFPGCVEVIETGGDVMSAHFGELNASACLAGGGVGTVTDGGTRDSAALLALNYPTFFRFQNPIAATGRWKVIEYQKPIQMPGAVHHFVPVHPGDFIFGDLDGVVVVPRELTLEILLKSEEHLEIERNARAELRAGADVVETFKKYGKF